MDTTGTRLGTHDAGFTPGAEPAVGVCQVRDVTATDDSPLQPSGASASDTFRTTESRWRAKLLEPRE
jgi:hypothetical protein